MTKKPRINLVFMRGFAFSGKMQNGRKRVKIGTKSSQGSRITAALTFLFKQFIGIDVGKIVPVSGVFHLIDQTVAEIFLGSEQYGIFK